MEKGELFGHYYVLCRIGSGSMCEVHLGFDLRRMAFVALKKLHEHHAKVRTFVKRMQREAECYRLLAHKNIVGYHDCDFESEGAYVAMEYLRGDNLTQRLRNEGGSLFLYDAIRILEDVAEALHWAHSKKVIHRDVRPDNIAVDCDGNAKLFDFGIAYANDQMVETRMGDIKLMGLYASPEQIGGEKLDERSDIYSLGVVFYEMLTGKKIHFSQTLEGYFELFKQHPQPPSQLDPLVPKSIDKIVLKMLRSEAAERYQEAREILVDTGSLRLSNDPQEIEKLFGKEADLLFEKARRAFEDRDYKGCIGICQQIEEQDVHRKASLYLLLARAAEALERPDISIRYLEKAAFLKSKDFSYALDYFCELIKRREFGRALELVKRSYPRRLDQDITSALKGMLERWEEPELVNTRAAGDDGAEQGGFFDRMKSLFSGGE